MESRRPCRRCYSSPICKWLMKNFVRALPAFVYARRCPVGTRKNSGGAREMQRESIAAPSNLVMARTRFYMKNLSVSDDARSTGNGGDQCPRGQAGLDLPRPRRRSLHRASPCQADAGPLPSNCVSVAVIRVVDIFRLQEAFGLLANRPDGRRARKLFFAATGVNIRCRRGALVARRRARYLLRCTPAANGSGQAIVMIARCGSPHGERVETA